MRRLLPQLSPLAASALGASFALSALTARPVQAASPDVPPPYSISVFASSQTGYSDPDSITFSPENVFVGYGNGGAPDGSGGAKSTIVEYKFDGTVVTTFTVVGHNDGLRYNPQTHELWASQNEDGNSNLAIINLKNGKQTIYQLGTGPHGGGYDDLVFLNGAAYLTASAPTINPNTAPSILDVKLRGGKADLTPVLMADAQALDVTTGKTVTLNLQDPDSMIVNPFGELVQDSQADGEVVVVSHPQAKCQSVAVVPLTSSYTTTPGETTVDDTIFATAPGGTLLVADKGGQKVYAITAPYFAPGAAYSSTEIDDQNGNPLEDFVGRTNLTTGFITPLITNMVAPGGMAFIPSSGDPLNGVLAVDPKSNKCP